MRQRLHTSYLSLFRPGEQVVDVGCGTGTDALFLAHHGIHVLGLDTSAGMLAEMQAKVASAGLAERVEARQLDAADLDQLPANSADGVISAFAALSTAPDFGAFARDAARLLRPGGRLVVHLLNRFSLWEWLGLVRRGQMHAPRALAQQRDRTFVIGGRPVLHRLYFAREAYARFFAPEFRLRRAYGLGALRPPHTVQRLPSPLVQSLEWLDVRVGGMPPFVNLGRFFVLEMEKRASAAGR
jgi:SAM-dependent methyltransferase